MMAKHAVCKDVSGQQLDLPQCGERAATAIASFAVKNAD
jgi:hypothetical protein